MSNGLTETRENVKVAKTTDGFSVIDEALIQAMFYLDNCDDICL